MTKVFLAKSAPEITRRKIHTQKSATIMAEMTTMKFRLLVATNLALTFACGLIEFFGSVDDVKASEEFSQSDMLLLALVGAIIVVMIGTTIGLLRFSWWSRPAALYMTIIGMTALLLVGPTAPTSSFSEMLQEASTLTTGALLAAAYWSGIGSRFSR